MQTNAVSDRPADEKTKARRETEKNREGTRKSRKSLTMKNRR